jgi:hypothetical protein
MRFWGSFVSTARAVLLFIIGLLLSILVFPVAFYVSVALGYLFGVIALVVGVWLAIKRAGRTLPLVLGIVLAIVATISIGATAFIHVAVYGIGKAVEEATKTKYVSGVIGQAVAVGDWEIMVLDIKEARYLRSGDSYFAAREGEKAVVVTLRIRNAGRETKSASDIWGFILVTSANKSYEDVGVFSFKLLWEVTDEVRASATAISELRTSASLAPGTYIEGDILFAVPQNETPQKLHFKVGIIGPTEVDITLVR